jgi:pimeloyl-ACP methyl ester carboxylesterase
VPPFAEEKKAAARALVEAARGLAACGWLAVTFDLRGTGDSDLEHGAVSLETWLADLQAVLAAHAVAGRPTALIGLRLGAALAWLAAGAAEVDQLVLWEPITSGSAYMRQNRQRSAIRRELTAGSGPAASGPEGLAAFDFDGFEIGAALHAGLAGIDLKTVPPPRARRVQILQVSGSARLKAPLVELQEQAAAAGLEASLDNVAVEAFWSAIGLVDTAAVRDATIAWLQPGEPAESPELAPMALLAPSAAIAGLTAEALSFDSGEQRCHGVLYRPAGEVERAVLLLHGWSGYRVGPGQLLTKAARALAAAGYAAYSFDFRGRGESQWEVGQASLNSMIRDAARAVPVVCQRCGASRVTLLGLCSGGEVAIGASLSEPAIDSLALWSAPIFSGNFDFARRARRGRKMIAEYWRKLGRRETWAKLLGGRLNLRLIARAVGGGRSAEDAGVADKAPDTATQMKAFEAFKGPLLLLYGGNDPETPPSREFYREFVERVGLPHRFGEVAGANHNFYSLAWQQELLAATLNWLRETGTRS